MISLGTASLLFIILWLVTFPVAWYLLARLAFVLISEKNKNRAAVFLGYFILYQVVIVLPYIPLLIADIGSGILKTILYGVVTAAIVVGFINSLGYKRIIKQLWTAYAYFYDGLLLFYPYRSLLSKVEKELSLKNDLNVLDLGCGTGNLERLILDTTDLRLVAVDSTAKMIKKAQKKLTSFIDSGNVSLHESDMDSFIKSQPEKYYDRIVMVNSLYTLENREKVWEECLRILRPGGTIVIANPDRKGSKSIIKEHLKNDSFLKLLHPKFIAIGIIDNFISILSDSDAFHFSTFEELKSEIEDSGGIVSSNYKRCYGGTIEGVNILFTVSKSNSRIGQNKNAN